MRSTISPRILVAATVGLVMVVGAYFITSQPANTAPDPRETAVVGPAPERDFITIDDEDGNGIADWKQTLPERPEWLTERAVATSTEEVEHASSTHTEVLAQSMLRRMLSNNMLDGFGDSPEEITERSAEYIQMLATDPLYLEGDIVIDNDTSADALRAYGNRVAEITFDNAVAKPVENELDILDTAVQLQSEAALGDLELIAASYEGMVADMLATPVPRTYVTEHLDLINTYNAVAVDIRGMQQTFTDPIYALVRIQRYGDDVYGIYQAISNLYLKLDEDGIEWGDDDIASQFIRIDR